MPPSSHALTAEDFKKLQQKDELTFEKYYNNYIGLVQFVIGRTGINDQTRTDLVQETFLKLFNHAHEISNHESVKAWLGRCARNLTIDQLRKKIAIPTEDEILHQQIDSDSENKQDLADRRAEYQVLANVITNICEQEGDDCLKLFYVDGISVKDIASRKKLPISTVTSRISRMRAAFSGHLRDHIEKLRENRL